MKMSIQSVDFYFQMGEYQNSIQAAFQRFKRGNILNRIWEHDYTVWKPSPAEISNRLGWLDIFEDLSPQKINEMVALQKSLFQSGYRHAVLLGMGGSSLAPELFSMIFQPESPSLSLKILDSTCPLSVKDIADKLDFNRTIFIVSTKSGTTEETLSFFKYFFRLLIRLNVRNPGEHFIAITDPGTKLEETAKMLKFRHVFLNFPNLGGRYSALSYFGLAPAALCGVDISILLQRAKQMAMVYRQNQSLEDNPAVMLGLSLGELAKSGCDKITFFTSQSLLPLCDWIEQLIAESTGKEGKGILPVVDEPIASIDHYDRDRLFIILELSGEEIDLPESIMNHFPSIRFKLDDVYDIGKQFFLWQLATAIAGYCLEINPFDQPNVEMTKKNVRQLAEDYKKTGKFRECDSFVPKNSGEFYFSIDQLSSPKERLQKIIEHANSGDYIAIQAFIYPQKAIRDRLQEFRISLRDKTKLATTLGFGPRFLHSTGQLHKGDRGNGLFIQITSDFAQDLPIPDSTESDASSLSFGALLKAQAIGDYLALRQTKRRVIRFHLEKDPLDEIENLTQILKSL